MRAGAFPRLPAEFGISQAGARNALSRVARRGLLEPDGSGRARAPRGRRCLAGLRAAYGSFIDGFAPVCVRTRGADVPAREALVVRTRLMDRWREFAGTDPGLPDELLPAGWPRDRARAVFTELDAALGPLATEYLNGLLVARPG